jgi:UDP-N-acetylmuramate dehydrogenase
VTVRPAGLDAVARLLGERTRSRVLLDEPLAPYTSYGIGGPADLALFPEEAEDAAAVVGILAARGVPLLVLGGGSNVLVSDLGVRGAVLFTTSLSRVEAAGSRVVAGAGASSDSVARAALDAGLEGAEFLARLPGTIGGACFMNARAYGGEISAVLERARVVDPSSGALSEAAVDRALFSYKRSPFMEDGAILVEVTLALAPAAQRGRVAARIREIEERRAASRELERPSCGCVFKNDERIGVPSGRLIESCGLKGYRDGAAQVSPHHANFVFNLGGATAAEVRRVIEHVRSTVAQRTGHLLELEVRFVGEWGGDRPATPAPARTSR